MAFEKLGSDMPCADKKNTSVCYCDKNITPSMLQCLKCQKLFHGGCLKNGRPSNFKGDVFFEFSCVNCSDTGKEICKRKTMNWLQVVYLALYNLICRGSGRKGYFRWKDDLCQFIDQYWQVFHPDKKRTSSWCSTVAGALSTHCPKIFKSGQKEFKEGGWWTLHEVLPPSEKPEVMTPGLNVRKKKKSGNLRTGEANKKRKLEVDIFENGGTAELPENCKAGTLVKAVKTEVNERNESKLSGTDISNEINTFFESNGDISELDIDDLGGVEEIFGHFEPSNEESLFSSFLQVNSHVETNIKNKPDGCEQPSTVSNAEQEVLVLDPKDLAGSQPSTSSLRESEDDTDCNGTIDESEVGQVKNLRMMQPYEERLLLEKLNKINSQDPKARRLRRKLMLNHKRRSQGGELLVFDLDKAVENSLNTVSHYVLQNNECVPVFEASSENTQAVTCNKPQRTKHVKHGRILDRFMMELVSRPPAKQVSFLGRLIGSNPSAVNRAITSPYTSRVLKPFIRRDFEAAPLKLKLLKEVCAWFQAKFPCQELPVVVFGPIDYCYVQPHHIPAVNALCREFFWPGIDLSECLQYPDFSCVVLYKKLIIGCAFMVPDVKCNEAYISFVVVHPDWRRAGIGSFMIYHLIQTCLGKDVTLHVAANNPAMLLYQKFGFKPERFVVGFYDRYYPVDGEHSNHAFFLRLQR